MTPIEDYLPYKQADITWITRVLAAEGVTCRDDFTRMIANRDKGASWKAYKHIGPHRNSVLRKLETVDDAAFTRITGLPIHATETAAQEWG